MLAKGANFVGIAPIVSPLLLAIPAFVPARNANEYTPWGRKEYRSHGVEESFRIWAIFSFLFFLISMVAGIIGLCCCCPYLTDTSFYDFFY